MYFWLKPTKKTLKKVEKMVFGQPWPTVQSGRRHTYVCSAAYTFMTSSSLVRENET